MQIIRAKSIDATDSGVIVKLSNLEALLLRNLCANVSVLQGTPMLIDAAKIMRASFASVYHNVNPALCAKNYALMPTAEQRMGEALIALGDF